MKIIKSLFIILSMFISVSLFAMEKETWSEWLFGKKSVPVDKIESYFQLMPLELRKELLNYLIKYDYKYGNGHCISLRGIGKYLELSKIKNDEVYTFIVKKFVIPETETPSYILRYHDEEEPFINTETIKKLFVAQKLGIKISNYSPKMMLYTLIPQGIYNVRFKDKCYYKRKDSFVVEMPYSCLKKYNNEIEQFPLAKISIFDEYPYLEDFVRIKFPIEPGDEDQIDKIKRLFPFGW